MTIVCISQDKTLRGTVVSLYGPESITFLEDARQLEPKALQSCELLIVDLEENKTPIGKNLNFPIIVLSSVPTFQEAVQLLQHGILGYGNRKMRKENLAQAIETITNGQMWLPPSIIAQLITTIGIKQAEPLQQNSKFTTLSKREIEVANYVAEGMANQEIADKMFISLRTVKAHLSSIYSKTGIRNRLELGLCLKSQR